jgi:hypothetical protein
MEINLYITISTDSINYSILPTDRLKLEKEFGYICPRLITIRYEDIPSDIIGLINSKKKQVERLILLDIDTTLVNFNHILFNSAH